MALSATILPLLWRRTLIASQEIEWKPSKANNKADSEGCVWRRTKSSEKCKKENIWNNDNINTIAIAVKGS